MITHYSLPESMLVLERGWLSSNNILFIGREQTALVDSGYLTHAEQTVNLVTRALHGRPLDRLLNTHLHSDHCGGNAALQAAFGCRTAIPASEADKVRSWDQAALSFSATGQQCARFDFDETIAVGDRISLGDIMWQALAAPGHDPHALMFYCAQEGILISADALWENGFGVIFPELDGKSGFAEARATLELIRTLDVRLVIPGHGAPFTDVAKSLDTAFSRLDYLSEDPARNAENAVKVLLKFLLLERQRMPLAKVPQLLSDIRLFDAANERYLHLSTPELANWTIKQLVRAGSAEVVDDMLINRD